MGELFWWGLACLCALVWLSVGLGQWRFWKTLPRLDRQAPQLDAGMAWPTVSVVVPSRNEAAAVEEATRTLLGMDYPALQVVAVDDRSQDTTGSILDRLAREDPRVRVVHVDTLADGWLGKNHANQQGAAVAVGTWLLFTDGDVMFSPDALKRAVALCTRLNLDHLACLPRLVCPGFWERCVQTATFGLISERYRMWELNRPGTAGYAGMGAFNLVKRHAYDRVGGHVGLRMEVADDLKLGMLLRRKGARQAMADAAGLVRVRWQQGFVASFKGLMKNTFAATNWSWTPMLPAILATFCSGLLPLTLAVVAPLPEQRALAALAVVLAMGIHGNTARRQAAGSGLEGLSYPVVAALISILMFVSSMSATLRRGITWRGTFYPLSALRAGAVDERRHPVDKVVGW